MNNQLTQKHRPNRKQHAAGMSANTALHQSQRQHTPRRRGDSQWVRAVPRTQAPARQRVLSSTVRTRAIKAGPDPYNRAQPPSFSSHSAPRHKARPQPKQQKTSRRAALIIAGLASVTLIVFSLFAAVLGIAAIYAQGTLPGVSVAGIDVGGLSQAEITSRLHTEWQTILLQDGQRTFRMEHQALGITLDAEATAQRAHAQGRSQGNALDAIFGDVSIAPVFVIDAEKTREGLQRAAQDMDIPPVNAGVAYVDGSVQTTPSQPGRALDIGATLARLADDPTALTHGTLEVMMRPVEPQITDATSLLQAAQTLLNSPLRITAYDPVTGDTVDWTATPQTWIQWIQAQPDPESRTGLALSIQTAPARNYLEARAKVFDNTRYINLDKAVEALNTAITDGKTSITVRVQHRERQHTVRQGESITSIAWDYGIPYPWLQQANPGVDSLSVGQQITIPPADQFLVNEPVPGKRIEVSLSQQRTRVYENGQLIWDWPTSTGINDSPTWPGIYQIISHERNAYAGRWNLWMPWFMGVYQPIPGADFTNGFHGFPTRGGGQILWQNNLGSRVTYGCIMLSNTNVQRLYDWAENGVVVEITP